jgi:hypothetical protein
MEPAVFLVALLILARSGRSVHGTRAPGSPAEIVAALAARNFKHVYVDGGVTIQGIRERSGPERVFCCRLTCA